MVSVLFRRERLVEDRLGERRVPSMFFTYQLREISEMRREMIVASELQQKILQESQLKEKKKKRASTGLEPMPLRY